ncbi:tRNA nucleotidyltransferase (CCA-adding enzyme) [Proteiniborus ethanoligenes]|uniref:tRNA nucleotidyltransferase (CCA-adding enzyme) n=1 Tax=Proteiniborus ethanoligenes TaxID=415015 RepID=A0A1H3Q0R1_9FIRM|nr:CCA tRNA nucleotidyltransferase [Proteiniborus ethanoligenes]TAH64104.1 MAG: CCA tRNA nucleotidyltransferase [Gottschalkiaceae bacterium]SDZ06309.1 tRNA nucleotidyltransferase (CCA-adding enzyme) [Proteiniborus ethanoligenes]
MKWILPNEINIIFDELKSNGFSGYIVGGCVRDILLGKKPSDWDICTDAKPEDMTKIFNKHTIIPTGIKHGTLTLIVNHKSFEITTFRKDKDYIDNRRPGEVEFTNNIYEDLKRRDFTINALAYNEEDGLIDCFHGIQDLNNKLVRSVGNPNERFNEDALRIIRGVRFSAQLQFNIDKDTALAMTNNKSLLNNISKERIREELLKILLTDKPSDGIRELISLGLMDYIIPELIESVGFEQKNPNHDKDVFNHIMEVLDNIDQDIVLRLAALLHDIGKPQCFSIDENGKGHFYGHHKKSAEMAEAILERLKFDNKTIFIVKLLVTEHMSRYDFLREKSIKKFINKVGIENLDRLFKLQIADIKGSTPPHDFSKIEFLRAECERVINQKEPMTVKDLAINGYHIMSLGISQGKEIGDILYYLLELVLENPEGNNEENLIKLAKEKILEIREETNNDSI